MAGVVLATTQHALFSWDQVTMASAVKIFLAVILVLGIATFAWLWGGTRSAKAGSQAPAQKAAVASIDCDNPVTRLQVRAVGITVDEWTGKEILDQVAAKGQTHSSIFSSTATDYPSTWTDKSLKATMRNGLAFKLGAGPAVDYAPLPVFVYGPTKDPENPRGAAFSIATARQQGSLPFHLFMTQKQANGTAPSLDEVFAFFDANPDAPAAIVWRIQPVDATH
jgi:hypothetical protein